MDTDQMRSVLSGVFEVTATNIQKTVFPIFIKACKRVVCVFKAVTKQKDNAVQHFLTKSHSKQGRQPLLGIFGYFTKSTYQLIQE